MAFGLAGLPVVPSLGLVWPGSVLPALPSTRQSHLPEPHAPAGGGFAAAVVVAGPGQGKPGRAGKAGPGQTKPRLGTTGKPAKPKQAKT